MAGHAVGEVRRRLSWLALAAIAAAAVAVLFDFSPAPASDPPEGAMPNPQLTSDAPGEITLSWDAPAPLPDDYRLMWSEDSLKFLPVSEPNEVGRGNEFPSGAVDGTARTSYTLSGLTPGETIKLRARTRYTPDGAGNSNRHWSGPWTPLLRVVVSGDTKTDQEDETQGKTPLDDPGNPIEGLQRVTRSTLRDATAPSGLTATHDSCGVNLSWTEPSSDVSSVTGYRVLRGASSSTLATLVSDTSTTDTAYADASAARGSTYSYAVQALRGATASGQSNTVQVILPAAPTATAVTVSAVPIVVTSTTNDYFVLYAKYDSSDLSKEMPVAVVRGQAGTTTLSENVPALPASRYRVEKYLISNPADVDGDCVDDITELGDTIGLNPINPTGRNLVGRLGDGAAAIPDRATFEQLGWELQGIWGMKFMIIGLDTEKPQLYFSNSIGSTTHVAILRELGITWDEAHHLRGNLSWRAATAGSIQGAGVYSFIIKPRREHVDALDSLDVVERVYTLLAASMPVVDDDLAYRIVNDWLPDLQPNLSKYQASRTKLAFEDELFVETSFLPLHPGESYGLLRKMDPDDRPGPRDIVIYESLPNELPRVAGILSTTPQTPLSHVNLRAAQDSIPNAYVRDALSDATVSGLIDRPVRYNVTDETWQIRSATLAEVNAHFDSQRPSSTQHLRRILSETAIKSFSDIGFESCEAYGVKASNLAVLGTLGFPSGTVPSGFAIPFHFYHEFMRQPLGEETLFGKKSWPNADKITLGENTRLIDAVDAILAHPRFQADVDIQEEMLDDLRDAIEDAASPQWIIDALTAMHANYPSGQSLRYRSSTNNEDLPGFNGAGLYDSNTQKPSETEDEGIDKSLKQVFASLWNYRAFAERDFNRVNHMTVAMGVAVHPNYKDELVNGVAVSTDPLYGFTNSYYINSQVGEDLVTNPEAESLPEEIVLHDDGTYTVLARSNLATPGQLLMTNAQLAQLRTRLEEIHDHFASLYNPAAGERFAIEIEFKITSNNILAIKQARPWIFTDPPAATITITPGADSLTARFDNPPTTHSGSNFEVDIRYSLPIKNSYTEFRSGGPAIQVTGGTVIHAGWRNNDRSRWYLRVRPSGNSDVTVVQIPHRPCTVRGGICTKDGIRLSTRLELVVRGPGGGSTTTDPVVSERAPCTGTNRAPSVIDDLIDSMEDDTVEFEVLDNDTDPNSHALFITEHTQPTRGTVTVDLDNTVTYTPDEHSHGTFSFDYTATDGEHSSTATVTVTVEPQNDEPQFPAATMTREVLSTGHGGSNVGTPVRATDIDGDDLSYYLSGADAQYFEIDEQTGQITVAEGVVFDLSGQTEFLLIVEADDGNGGFTTSDVTIRVVARITPPRVIGSGSFAGGFGGGAGGAPAVILPSDEDFDYNKMRDLEGLDRENGNPTGLWSDGAVLWVLNNAEAGADAVFAYDLETGERREALEFPLDNRNRFSHGIWSDGATAWIADSGGDRLFAYDLETGERVEERDLELSEDNRDPRGIWSDGETIYVLDSVRDRLFVYDFETGELLAEHKLASLNRSPRGIWSDGVTIWISDDGANRVFAYRLVEGELQRFEDEEFSFRPLLKAGNGEARGIWSDGDVLWVADQEDAEIYSYNLPDAAQAKLAALSLSGVDLEFSSEMSAYSVGVAYDRRSTTVTATATQPLATVDIAPLDADLAHDGHQVDLDDHERITVTVTSADGSRIRTYEIDIERAGCLTGALDTPISEVSFVGGTVADLVDCSRQLDVSTVYHYEDGDWVALFLNPELPDFLSQPFYNRFPSGLSTDQRLFVIRGAPGSD